MDHADSEIAVAAAVRGSERVQAMLAVNAIPLLYLQADALAAPTTLTGLVIAVSLGMLAVLTWTVKELLRINEKHADAVRRLSVKVSNRHDDDGSSDEPDE